MKYCILLIVSIISLKSLAQSKLIFNKRFVECEDKWVAFKMNKDSFYTFGFIYIDEQAGLTFNKEGDFKFNEDSSLKVERITESSIKVRLQANNVKVAVIPESMYKDLQIEKLPEWLKNYKNDTGSVSRLYKWGYMYNGWNECAKALTYLVRAKQVDPNFEGLNVELAFSYNCLEQYDKAEQILVEEIKVNPSNAYVNKEYIYTLTKNKKIDIAGKQFFEFIKSSKQSEYNAENCYNILQYYYFTKDKENFNKWYEELLKWPNNNKMINTYADRMKNDLNK